MANKANERTTHRSFTCNFLLVNLYLLTGTARGKAKEKHGCHGNIYLNKPDRRKYCHLYHDYGNLTLQADIKHIMNRNTLMTMSFSSLVQNELWISAFKSTGTKMLKKQFQQWQLDSLHLVVKIKIRSFFIDPQRGNSGLCDMIEIKQNNFMPIVFILNDLSAHQRLKQ